MDIRKEIENLIHSALKKLDISLPEVILEYPAEISHGDFATNVALIAAKQAKKNPREFAEQIRAQILENKPDFLEKIEVAGPGFINFFLSREFLSENVALILKSGEKFGQNKSLKGEEVLVEYTDPNPFKEFHIGHLMSNAIGESIARLYGNSGADVKRMCYQGDVGSHVAKTIWALIHEDGALVKFRGLKSSVEKVKLLGEMYAIGSSHDNQPSIQTEITDINKKVFDKSDKKINEIYKEGRQYSLDYFNTIYVLLGTKFDYNFFESEVYEEGEKIVQEFLKKGVFEKSENAVVFHAEKYDKKLHTRVFITSQGLPTYETKELGLIEKKFKKIKPDLSITVTANEQSEYFKVVLKAVEIIFPKIKDKIEHISHGMMRFADGKMSSRTGNVITGVSLIADMEKMVGNKIKDREFDEETREKVSRRVAVAAIKYSILRQGIAGDIIFDADKSISFEGDSGPYLQYSVVRANSVIEKAKKEGLKPSVKNPDETATTLERKLARFPEVAARALSERAPHHVATYLTDLASEFNSYYATTKIADKENIHSSFRLALTQSFAVVMKNGLNLLGIEVPEKM